MASIITQFKNPNAFVDNPDSFLNVWSEQLFFLSSNIPLYGAGALLFDLIRRKCCFGCGAQSWDYTVGFEGDSGSRLARFVNAVVNYKILSVWSQISFIVFCAELFKILQKLFCVNKF